MNELNFIKEIDLLKNVERQTSTFNVLRKENSAEHSWHLAMSVYVFRHYSEKELNLEKCLLLALIHDVVEIDSGDTFVYDNQQDKSHLEEKTLLRLTGILNNKTSDEIKSLWYEYESNISNEAQYVNALDRFLPIYANYLSKGFSWKKHGIKRSQVIDRNKNKIILGLPILWPIVEMIMNEAIEEKYLVNDME